MSTVEIKLNLTDDVLEYLQQEARKRHITLDVVVSEVVAEYFEDPTKEELLSGLQAALRQVFEGKARPVDDLLAELKAEFDFDTNES